MYAPREPGSCVVGQLLNFLDVELSKQTLRSILRRILNPVRTLPPQEAYDRWAPTYDDYRDNAVILGEEHALLPLLDALRLQSSSIADFGCGTGRHIRHFLDRGARQIIGIDNSLAMLGQAHKKFLTNNVSLVQSDLDHVPFRDGYFDAGLAALVLSHVADIEPAIHEFARLLKPGGRLIITDLHQSFEERGWKRTFMEMGTKFAVRNYPHSVKEYHEAFRSNNFVVEKELEPPIDSALRPVFERTGHVETFERFQGQPLLLVFQVRKER